MSNSVPKPASRLRFFFPDPYLMGLMLIGFADLISTAVLHANGLIVEMNPLLRPIIERSEWLFALVKGATLLVAYIAMIMYAKHRPEFVQKASRLGIVMYIGIYIVWFFGAMLK